MNETHENFVVATQPEKVRTSISSRRGRITMIVGLSIVLGFFLITFFADFLAPYKYYDQSRREPQSSPSYIKFRDEHGQWYARPFIHMRQLVDSLEYRYEENLQRAYPLEFFAQGYEYKLLWIFPTDRHLFGVRNNGGGEMPRIHLLGTDSVGRDRLSRLLVATRFSLLVGPLGTLLASMVGIAIGCIAGYAGYWLDAVLMRIADAMMALPALVLILAARAAFPLELPPLRAATLLITIFVILGWAEMARLARGLVMELRERDFVIAARSIGLSPLGIVLRHVLPNAARPLAVQALLMLPAFLLAETALSFLGVGLQEPEASWGTMLREASELTLLERSNAFVLLAPAFAIALFVLGVRLFSNGLEAKSDSQR